VKPNLDLICSLEVLNQYELSRLEPVWRQIELHPDPIPRKTHMYDDMQPLGHSKDRSRAAVLLPLLAGSVLQPLNPHHISSLHLSNPLSLGLAPRCQ